MSVSRKLMPNYVLASISLSLGGILNGYDTGSIGAIAGMRQFKSSMGGELSPLLTGITVSMIMLTGIIPSLFSGHLADKYGRLRLIAPGALLFSLGAILQGTATHLAQFILGRAISGAGQGIFLGNITVYIAEVAPPSQRGCLSAMPQFMSTLGICVGYFSCYGTASLENALAWRLPYIAQVLISIVLALVCKYFPESPRWLALHGRAEEVQTALHKLDLDLGEARRDFLATVQETPTLSNMQSFVLLFRRGYRSKTFLALFTLSMVQLSGIDAITYYAPALFAQAGISSDKSSLVASGVSSITMLVISIPAVMLADKWNRRASAISGGLVLSGIMLLMGILYASGAVTPHSAANWVVVVCVFLFGMVFCATWGIVMKVYASEIQPGNTRGAANSVGMAFSYFTNWLVALITPILLNASAYGAYFLFGGLALLTVAVLTVYMPETRGRSLEAIQSDFQRPVRGILSSIFQHHNGAHREPMATDDFPLPPLPSRSSNSEALSRNVEMQLVVGGAALASSVSPKPAPRGLRAGTTLVMTE